MYELGVVLMMQMTVKVLVLRLFFRFLQIVTLRMRVRKQGESMTADELAEEALRDRAGSTWNDDGGAGIVEMDIMTPRVGIVEMDGLPGGGAEASNPLTDGVVLSSGGAAGGGATALLDDNPDGLYWFEEEELRDTYKDVTGEYKEICVYYGYIVLFAAAFPLAPVVAAIVLQVELRTDAFKLLACKRPMPTIVEDIGNWYRVFDVLTYIAILTNTALVFFTQSSFFTNDEGGKIAISR
jgi:hypothetical protein